MEPFDPWLSAPALLLQGSGFSAFLPLLLIFGIFFLLVILPARRRQKKLEQMIANLVAGDRVVTNGGLVGTVVGLGDDRVTLRIAPDGVKLRFTRSSVVGMAEKAES